MSAGLGSMASSIRAKLPDALKTNLTVWLTAEDYTGTSWPNRGTAPAATVVSSPAPVIVPAGLNNLPTVKFTHAQGMIRGTGMCTDGALDLTVMYIGRTWGTTKGRMFACVYPPYNVLIGTHGTGGEPCMYDNGWVSNGTPPWGTIPTAWKCYGMTSSNGAQSLLMNGVTIANGTASNGHDNRYALSGYEAATTAESSDCEIAEVLVWNKKLTGPEITSAWTYFKKKWGINQDLSFGSMTPSSGNWNASPYLVVCTGTGFVQGDTEFRVWTTASLSTLHTSGLATVNHAEQCTFPLSGSMPYQFSVALYSRSKAITTPTLVFVMGGISPP